MFGRDPITPIAKLLEPQPRFYGEKGGSLHMSRARERQPWQETTNKLQVGDLVFVHDPDSGVFEPRYSLSYQIIAIHGANRIEVQDEKGHKSVQQAGHVQKIEPVDKVCHHLPPEEVYKQFGRASKLLIHPKYVPDIDLLIPSKAINGREDITEVNEEVKCKEDVCDRQNPSNKSEKLIITATRHEGECAPNSEQFKEHICDMDNSDNSIYRLNVDKITRDDDKRFNKFSDESEILLNRLDTDTLKSYVQGEDIQECTPSTNWTSDKSEKLLNCLSLDDTLVNPFRGE